MNGDNNASFFALYKLLAMMGAIERSEDVVPGFRYKDSRITLALPNAKFGIAFQGDKVSDLVDDGWKIERLTTHDLDPFLRVFDMCDNARIALEKRKMDPNVKMTSQPEELVLHEIMRRMLPIPDRNYKFTRDDGTELTTPDFTWEKYKIAFFLDGSYWHSIKGNKEIIKKIKADKQKQNDIVIQRSDKARKDGQIRSELGSMGWIVLSCTDSDVETQDGVNRVVDLIERTINNVQISSQIHVGNATTQEEDDLFSSLLNPVDETSSENAEQNTSDSEEKIQDNTYNVNDESHSELNENIEKEEGQNPSLQGAVQRDLEQDEGGRSQNDFINQDSEENQLANTNVTDDQEENEQSPINDLKGSIFDYIGDYDHENEEIEADQTNNYSPPEEEAIDISEVAESDIDIREEIPYEVIAPDEEGVNTYEEYDAPDDILFDDELEDIFFLDED